MSPTRPWSIVVNMALPAVKELQMRAQLAQMQLRWLSMLSRWCLAIAVSAENHQLAFVSALGQPLASKKLKRFFIFTHGSYSHGYTLRAGKNCRKKALAQSLLLKVQMCSFIHDNNVNIKICITKHVCFGDTMIHVEEVSTLFYMVATSDSDNLRYVYSCHLNS